MNQKLIYLKYLDEIPYNQRAAYDPELEFYSLIKAGALKEVALLCEKSPLIEKKGIGILSSNPVQSLKYHFVITAAMIARYCIEGGMDVSKSYDLSDYYIQKCDNCKSQEEVSDLHKLMCIEYAKHMKSLESNKVGSYHIVRCLDYIHNNLHTRITVDILSDLVGVSPAYLSRLFKEETGNTISGYIQNRKINTACNMLIYSDYTSAEIANILAFPSQSYFCDIFKKYTEMTPSLYRSKNLRTSPMGSHNQQT